MSSSPVTQVPSSIIILAKSFFKEMVSARQVIPVAIWWPRLEITVIGSLVTLGATRASFFFKFMASVSGKRPLSMAA